MRPLRLIDAWMHDAPTNVLRLPIFPVDTTPAMVIAEACVKYNRVALLDVRQGVIWLAKVPG